MATRIDDWLTAAIADAERRGLPELKPLLETLARSTVALRAADVEVDARERREAEHGLMTEGSVSS
jgi:hypothetical protein